MKVITWNVRGINAPNKQRILKHYLPSLEGDIMLIQKTKLDEEGYKSLKKKVGIWEVVGVPSSGASGGLGVLWDPRWVLFSKMGSSSNWICGKVQSLKSKLTFIIINIYGPKFLHEKREVWAEIDRLAQDFSGEHIFLGGDFNAVLNMSDKQGGSTKETQTIREFREWLQNNHYMEIQTTNGEYTWSNRRSGATFIAEKLDRFFFKGNLANFDFDICSSILSAIGSDHLPVQLTLVEHRQPSRYPFRFKKMWLKDENLLQLIEKWWGERSFKGSKAYIFISKLKYVKKKLMEWNRDSFGDIFEKKRSLEQ
ncbi:uncharacterized protein LOC131040632 [Cryptomeria japonica]|uniref:uncharacterized protein LOC131040632 n=1 Tax=Cryptomeria japonica TaxID=3369 RepID=UPI0025AC2341|nr:uncharacterized protein LOC131040632 [Cryptomeria japonica]